MSLNNRIPPTVPLYAIEYVIFQCLGVLEYAYPGFREQSRDITGAYASDRMKEKLEND